MFRTKALGCIKEDNCDKNQIQNKNRISLTPQFLFYLYWVFKIIYKTPHIIWALVWVWGGSFETCSNEAVVSIVPKSYCSGFCGRWHDMWSTEGTPNIIYLNRRIKKIPRLYIPFQRFPYLTIYLYFLRVYR